MKPILLSLVLFFFITSAYSQEATPTPEVISNFLDMVKEDPGGYIDILTPESTRNTFHKYLIELLDQDREIQEGDENYKLSALEVCSMVLAEHHNLSGHPPEKVIIEYGYPQTIHRIKEEFALFKSYIPITISFGTTKDLETVKTITKGSLECYEYPDFYIWFISSAENKEIKRVLAISPRSVRFDMYLKKYAFQ